MIFGCWYGSGTRSRRSAEAWVSLHRSFLWILNYLRRFSVKDFNLKLFGTFCRYDRGPKGRSGQIGSRFSKFGCSWSDMVRGLKRTSSDNVYGLRRKRMAKLVESGSFKGRKGLSWFVNVAQNNESGRWISGYGT